MKRDNPKQVLILAAFGIAPVVWLGLLIAPSVGGGLPAILQSLAGAMNNPLRVVWCADSLRTVLVCLAAYAMGIGLFLSMQRNTRPREEHGSAKWGDAASVNRKYRDKRFSANKILTQNVRLGLDGHKHCRNLNVLVCGGSGAGKTRFFAKPNVMQCNTSMVILDPKGEICRDTGHLLRARGVAVKVLDLINMSKSYCYNPFSYLLDDNDVQRLVTNLFKATTPKGSQSQDPFWDTAASMLLLALIFYLKYEAPQEEQCFPMVMEMLRAGEVHEDDDRYISPLDELFLRLESEEPEHIAVKYYKDYHSGSAKTLKSIQITLAARLEKFNLDSLAKLTATDELDLASMGEKKTALFVIIPDNDTSFNFLVSILYTQLFQALFRLADHKFGGALSVPVHFVMDEFANVSLPDDFDKILSVMRSRGVSVSIILQNMAQLKALFEKQWESIVGNCDSFLYIGGNEKSTHQYVSELLGKETLDVNTFGKTLGHNGSYTTNYQQHGRELMTPDEVRMLDNRYALLFIRGERPVLDLKFDLLRHPHIAGITDGGTAPFDHGATKYDLGTAALVRTMPSTTKPSGTEEPDTQTDIISELLSEQDLEMQTEEQEKKYEEPEQTQASIQSPVARWG
jgi:type IV secretion system protein VirD4